MDVAHVRALLFATLEANADTRRQAELQLKQVWSLFLAGLGRMGMGASAPGRDTLSLLAPGGPGYTLRLGSCYVTPGSRPVLLYASFTMPSSRPAVCGMMLEGTAWAC